VAVETLKAAKKAIGAKQAAKAVEKGLARLVYIAADADGRVTAPLRDLCSRQGVPTEIAPSMAELGEACGIEVGAAAVAILNG
jgi:large subunit ribosomal protein L7A